MIQDTIQVDIYENVTREEEDSKLVDLHDIITKEDTYWRHRSRKIFLKEGVRNRKYFYMTTMKLRMVNKISRLKVNVVFTEDEEDIKREAIRFFTKLLERESQLDKEK